MCPPAAAVGAASAFSTFSTVLSVVGTVASVVSTFTQARGQVQRSQAQADDLRRQAQITEFNAKVTENNAILARQAAEADADTIDRQRRIALAKQTTGFAASGVVINEGSTLEVLGDTAAEFELDRLNRLHEGKVKSNAQRIQGLVDRNNAQGLLSQASSAERAGTSSAIGTVLGGAGKIAGNLPSSIFPQPSVRNVAVPGPLSAASGISAFGSLGPP